MSSRIIQRINAVLSEMDTKSVKLAPAIRKKINAELAKGVTSGYPYVRSFGTGLSAAWEIVAKYGLEPARATSPPLSYPAHLRIPLAFTNKEDSFSPVDIENAYLIVAVTKMSDEKFEIVAYIS